MTCSMDLPTSCNWREHFRVLLAEWLTLWLLYRNTLGSSSHQLLTFVRWYHLILDMPYAIFSTQVHFYFSCSQSVCVVLWAVYTVSSRMYLSVPCQMWKAYTDFTQFFLNSAMRLPSIFIHLPDNVWFCCCRICFHHCDVWCEWAVRALLNCLLCTDCTPWTLLFWKALAAMGNPVLHGSRNHHTREGETILLNNP